jgi:hypothetical protein
VASRTSPKPLQLRRKRFRGNRLAIILRGLAEILAAFGFGGGVLCWVAAHSGSDQGVAIIHVADENVDVHVGSRTFHIVERDYNPILCELPAGRHTLLMKRGELVLCREEFVLDRGGEIVLTAWDEAARTRTVTEQVRGGALGECLFPAERHQQKQGAIPGIGGFTQRSDANAGEKDDAN